MTDAVDADLLAVPLTCLPQKQVLKAGMVVFCDFDGPLMDVSERYYSTYQLGLAETQAIYIAQGQTLSLQMLSKTRFWQMKRDRRPDVEIAQESGLVGEQIDQFLQQVGQIVNQPALLYKDEVQQGAAWALSRLRDRGIRLMLVTLRNQEQVISILHQYGLMEMFSGIYGASDSLAAYYNHADHKTVLLKQALTDVLEQDWQPGWMIGDTEADILAAQALGLPTISLTCGIRSRLYLEQFRPNLIYQNLRSAVHDLLDSRHHTNAYSELATCYS